TVGLVEVAKQAVDIADEIQAGEAGRPDRCEAWVSMLVERAGEIEQLRQPAAVASGRDYRIAGTAVHCSAGVPVLEKPPALSPGWHGWALCCFRLAIAYVLTLRNGAVWGGRVPAKPPTPTIPA